MHILIDLDNVLLNTFYQKDGKTFFYWTQNLEKDLGLDPKTLGQLFTKEFFQENSDEIYERVKHYLGNNAPHISADAFLNYWMEHDSNLNDDVWTWVWNNHHFKKHNFYIASDQTGVRMNYLLGKFPVWKDVFRNIFTSYSLGVCKNNPLFFQRVLSEIKSDGSDVYLIDDNQENINSARILNIQTILFLDSSSLPKIL